MKKIFILFFVEVTLVFTQSNVEIELKNLWSGSQSLYSINSLIMNSFKNSNYGTYLWLYKNDKWSEGYGGLTYMPTNNLQLGAGLGIEDAENPLRLSSMIWLGNKKWSILSLFEDGGSGKWHQINAKYTFNNYINFGLMEEKFSGSGPRLEFNIPRFPISAWISFLNANKKQSFYFAIKLRL